MDIHCDQLVEVLSKRGVLSSSSSSWQTDLQKVKNAFPEALALIPSEWTEAVESSSADLPTMGYWRCQRIFAELLRKKQEAGSAGKTWLGSYKDPLLHKWDVILRAYRKGNIFLAETATLLDVNSTYEIPALKKEVGLCESRIGQLNKRIRDTAAQINRQREDLELFCQERGIKNGSAPTAASILDDTNRAIRKELPTLLAQLHAKIRDPGVRRAVELYRAFCEFMGFDGSVAAVVVDDAAAAVGASGEARKPLATLALFSEYEGPVASVAELPDLPISLLGGAASQAGAGDVGPGEIDWGDLEGINDDAAGASSAADEIDWDIGEEVAAAAAVGEPASADLSTGGEGNAEEAAMLDISAMASAEGPEPEDGGDMIDLGIEMEMDFEDFGIELGDAGSDVAENKVEHSLVELSAREALTNDLLELQCFLQQRVHEMAADTGNTYFSLTRDASEVRALLRDYDARFLPLMRLISLYSFHVGDSEADGGLCVSDAQCVQRMHRRA